MKKDIFISYRREDSSFFAAKLRDRLEQVFPGQIFLDISAISAGEDFVNTLKDSVSASKVVIVVVSRYWHTSSDGKTKLGVNGDFVTEEIGMALELGIPVIPVILDDASMPSVEVLPMRLQGLVRRNAVFISHAHFDSDIDYLINAIYVQLGLKPPTALEKFLEAIPGAKFRFNVRIRDQIAIYSFLSSLLVALFLGIWFVFFRFTDNDNSSVSDVLLSALGYSVLSLLFNIIGLNSSRRYRFALFGTFISLLTLIFASGFGVVGVHFTFSLKILWRIHGQYGLRRGNWLNFIPINLSYPLLSCLGRKFLQYPDRYLKLNADV